MLVSSNSQAVGVQSYSPHQKCSACPVCVDLMCGQWKGKKALSLLQASLSTLLSLMRLRVKEQFLNDTKYRD